jgi:hypothetical protein
LRAPEEKIIFWLRNNHVLTQKSFSGGDGVGGDHMLLVLAKNQWLTI